VKKGAQRGNPHFALFLKYGGSIKADTIGGACRETKVTNANKTVVEKPERKT
jgi:hypothetical protein